MKIALTGSSSTGKTSLADGLMKCEPFRTIVSSRLTLDARAILRGMGHQQMDQMTTEESRNFQISYFTKKLELEDEHEHFLVERSFVDVAAYWHERDSIGMDQEKIQEFLENCRRRALQYDHHIMLPYGMIPFDDDGYRSLDISFHKRIDSKIRKFLLDWNVGFLELRARSIADRVIEILNYLGLQENG